MIKCVSLEICEAGCILIECTVGDVRLVGGRNQYEGAVEYCREQGWRTVCSINVWTDFEAALACNATGLQGITNGGHRTGLCAYVTPHTCMHCD